MFFKQLSNRISVSVLAIIMIPALSSFGDSFSEKWEVESIRFMFPETDADDVPADEPVKTVWRLLESVVDEDKNQFADQYSESNQETTQQEFKKWQERLSHGYPMAMVLQGEREDGVACLALYSLIREKAPKNAYFSDIMLLRQNKDNMWKIIPSIENEQEIAYIEELFRNERQKLFNQFISERRKKDQQELEKRMAESDRETLETFKENFGEEQYERMIKAEKLEKKMKEAGKKIPSQNNFHEMIEILDFEFFDPPRILDARHNPGAIDSSEWRQVVRKLLHLRWKNSELTPKVFKLDDIEPEAKSLVQVLFTISREIDDIPFKIVFFFAFDKDTDFTDQFVTPSKLVLGQDKHGNWTERKKWSEKHIFFGRLTGIIHNRIRFRSSDFGTMPGKKIRKAFEDSDLPPPLDRIYDVSECVDF